MFKPVTSQVNFPQMEEAILRSWKIHHIFQKSSDLRSGGPEFVFYEGPPTANGLPYVHHIPARAFKDIFLRFKTMRGYHVVRRGGWDTHGLPVEISVERNLGFTNKSQIEAYGIDRFTELCRQSVFEYIQDWEKFTDRLAYWVDLDDAYVTYTNEYIESIWWILKTLWERDLLYEGFKVLPYCPRCGTPLSDHEVAMGYQQTVDPSVYFRLPLLEDPGTSLLVWTTTPWTLPGNVAVAAHPEVDYVIVERTLPETAEYNRLDLRQEKLILAKDLVHQVFKDEEVQIYESFKGTKLRGLQYRPLYTFLLPNKPAYYVLMGDFVTTEDGTGLVHIAPAFGAVDMQAAIDFDLPILQTVTEEGTFTPDVRPWSGKFVKNADPLIIEDLENRGLLFNTERYAHSYPFCWRCDTPLLYYARNSWFIRTTSVKDQLVTLNQRINWIPDHIKNGRFGNWLENNIDWALGRERYWGTPLPVWQCDECHHQVTIGSIAELSELADQDLSDLDLHRPHVDEVKFPCPMCGEQMGRVPDLIDVWFDSGSMPIAQWHYPFEGKEKFDHQFPADFICEGVDQTRGWFYALHTISTLLFDQECFRNVISLGLFLDADGRKMSKSRGNVIDPWDIFNQYGADAMRWYLYTSGAPGQDRRFSIDQVEDVVRSFILPLWNVYVFFVTYALLDNWKPYSSDMEEYNTGVGQHQSMEATPVYNNLDRWLLSELHALVRDVTVALETYDVPGATRPIQSFVALLSRWYLRRSRRRFWKSEVDADKNAAYSTLYEVLVKLSQLLAPTMPFLAETIFTNLVGNINPQAPSSVHLSDWPSFDSGTILDEINTEMHLIMKLASLAHAARNKAGVKVRQPLEEAAFFIGDSEDKEILGKYKKLLTNEINVKNVRTLDSASEVIRYKINPLPNQLGQKYKEKYPEIKSALLALNAGSIAPALLNGDSIFIMIDNSKIEILPSEVEVQPRPIPGHIVATEGKYLVALNTELTLDLVQEGIARDIVRHVQELRKSAGFDIADRIYLYLYTTGRLWDAVVTYRSYIVEETLASELIGDTPPQAATSTIIKISGLNIHIGIIKAPKIQQQ